MIAHLLHDPSLPRQPFRPFLRQLLPKSIHHLHQLPPLPLHLQRHPLFILLKPPRQLLHLLRQTHQSLLHPRAPLLQNPLETLLHLPNPLLALRPQRMRGLDASLRFHRQSPLGGGELDAELGEGVFLVLLPVGGALAHEGFEGAVSEGEGGQFFFGGGEEGRRGGGGVGALVSFVNWGVWVVGCGGGLGGRMGWRGSGRCRCG
mmetsp:Transcript_25031/g.51714  ORF Transcript_25031/g.51714 Transcript_25031/m.51714 type:complete len:204 (+) Transcript_25031:610-1221(+)